MQKCRLFVGSTTRLGSGNRWNMPRNRLNDGDSFNFHGKNKRFLGVAFGQPLLLDRRLRRSMAIVGLCALVAASRLSLRAPLPKPLRNNRKWVRWHRLEHLGHDAIHFGVDVVLLQVPNPSLCGVLI